MTRSYEKIIKRRKNILYSCKPLFDSKMECKREKSSMRVIILQTILIVLYTVSFVFAIIAIGLFGKAQHDLQKLHQMNNDVAMCTLFLLDDKDPSTSNCNHVFAGEVLTATGLAVLLILSIIKLLCGFMKLVQMLRVKSFFQQIINNSKYFNNKV